MTTATLEPSKILEEAGLTKTAKPRVLTPEEIQDVAEKRILKDAEGNERTFLVLVIDSAEKWLAAESYLSYYDLPQLGTNNCQRFNFKGISLSGWDEIESAHIMPTWEGEGEPNLNFHREKEVVAKEKMVHVLELALGYKIPGNSWSEKAAWMDKMNPGELQAIYMAAQYDGCGMRDGKLMSAYNELASRAESQVKPFTGFESLSDASKSQYFLRIHRTGDDYIMEFPLKGISSKQREDIDNECREPEPPKVPKRDPMTRKLDFQNMVPNKQDKQWLDACRLVNRRRMIMYLSACLMFEIPGKSISEQFEWVGSRLVGDVLRLKNFITEELTSYYSRYRFL